VSSFNLRCQCIHADGSAEQIWWRRKFVGHEV
jgi:hypothetical protein